MVKWYRGWELINQIPYPNDIFNGPIYQRYFSLGLGSEEVPSLKTALVRPHWRACARLFFSSS